MSGIEESIHIYGTPLCGLQWCSRQAAFDCGDEFLCADHFREYWEGSPFTILRNLPRDIEEQVKRVIEMMQKDIEDLTHNG